MLKISLEDLEDLDETPRPAAIAIELGVNVADKAGASDATLRAAAAQVELARRQAAGFGEAVQASLSQTIATTLAYEPQLDALLQDAAAVADAILAAYEARYSGKLAPEASGAGARHEPIDRWRAHAVEELQAMQAAHIPFFSKARMRQRDAFATTLRRRLGLRVGSEHKTLVVAYSEFHPAALAAARQAMATDAAALDTRRRAIARLPPVMGALGEGAMSPGPIPGVGPLVLSAGSVRLGDLTLAFRAPGATPGSVEATTDVVSTGSYDIPVLLDLDRDGGMYTDRAATVNNVVLRLLALLPAGQVKATIFDPARLGESASFLFDLGDAVEAVIGTKVKTTERELSDALLELEDHITFVTQKYLQGVYHSLTDYNVAAGDVAEPYRLLVLHDFPKGFVRPTGGADDEALARLRKIVEVGRRCGVFTLVVGPHGTGGPLTSPLSRIPWLWHGQLPNPRWRALFTTGDKESTAFDLALEPAGLADQTQPQLALARTSGAALFTVGAGAEWVYHGEQPAADSTVKAILASVERGISVAGDVRVSPDQVAELARARLARDVQRATREPEVLPLPADRATWWHGGSRDEVVAAFGRVGANDVGLLRLDSRTASGAVIGGRPGSGKSVLIHALIAALVLRYPPDELELYLVDFKEGVEFKVYATGGLPHARVVAVESEREFGLSVLQSLDAEITRRGVLFREGGEGEDVNLATYRKGSPDPLARVVLIIDEFHVLFDRDDKVSTAAGELLDRIVRQGRAFGVHAILASQTIAGTSGLGRHTLNLLPIRIALQCSDADSRLLLADDNADARLLTRPGEGILNTSEGMRDGNVRFQAAFTPPEERVALVAELRGLADERGFARRPVIFEGNAAVRAEEILGDEPGRSSSPSRVSFPVGMPMTLGGPLSIELRREPGGNLLLIDDDAAAIAVLTVALTSCASAGVAVRVLDFGPLDGGLSPMLETLRDCLTLVRRRDAPTHLLELAALVKRRGDLGEHRAASEVCVIAALHRARDLADGNEVSDALEEILRDGPDVGIHVVVWCDKPVSLERRLSSSARREFGMRLVGPMSREDSMDLVDSEIAAQIKPSQAVFDDHDRATTVRLRRFSMPDLGWVARVAEPGP